MSLTQKIRGFTSRKIILPILATAALSGACSSTPADPNAEMRTIVSDAHKKIELNGDGTEWHIEGRKAGNRFYNWDFVENYVLSGKNPTKDLCDTDPSQLELTEYTRPGEDKFDNWDHIGQKAILGPKQYDARNMLANGIRNNYACSPASPIMLFNPGNTQKPATTVTPADSTPTVASINRDYQRLLEYITKEGVKNSPPGTQMQTARIEDCKGYVACRISANDKSNSMFLFVNPNETSTIVYSLVPKGNNAVDIDRKYQFQINEPNFSQASMDLKAMLAAANSEETAKAQTTLEPFRSAPAFDDRLTVSQILGYIK